MTARRSFIERPVICRVGAIRGWQLLTIQPARSGEHQSPALQFRLGSKRR